MSRSLGRLTLDLIARTGGFTEPLDKASRQADKQFRKMEKDAKQAAQGFTVAASAIAAASTGLAVFTNNAAQNARELKNQAAIANSSAQEFQRFSYAARTVGVEQGKLSDIFKDTTDRVGDFLQTGGGPMADFFENIAPQIGVTAQQFKNLSGPEALQKFYQGLEQANLSQSEMTFYMEAIASDATALIPLLRDGGAGFAEMAREADKLGIVLSDGQLGSLDEFAGQFDRLTGVMSAGANVIAAELAPSLSGLADELVGVAVAFQDGEYDTQIRALEGAATAAATAAGMYATYRAAVGAATIAQWAFNAALRANPIGLIATGVTAAVAGMGALGAALDDSAEKAKRMEFRANELAESLKEMGETSIRTQLAAVTLELAKMDGAQEALEEQSRKSSRTNSVLAADFRDLHDTIQTTVVAARHGSEEHEKLRTQQLALEKALELVTKAGGQTTRTVQDYGGAAAGAADSVAALKADSDEFARTLEALRNRLQPARAAQIQMAQSMNTLTLGYAAGSISLNEYLELVGLLQQAHMQAVNDTEDLAVVTETTVDDMARAWERAGDDIDRTFADAFAGAFDSFESFADQLENAFKRLLAELAYQATLRPIVVGITGQVGGALGIPGMGGQAGALGGGGFGGIGSLAQGADKLFGTNIYGSAKNLLGFGGSLGAAGTAATGYAGAGWASSVATGGYTGWAGSAAAGSAAAGGGGILSTLSSAAPWIAGGLAIDNILGLGIVDGIAGLFGRSKTPFSGRFGTREAGAGGFEHLGNEEREGQFYRDSALGRVGFFDRGTERLQRAGTGSKDWADELSAAAAEMDNLVASLAQSEDELSAMRETVQGMVVSSRNANDIIQFALVDRPQAALEHIGGRFGDFVRSLEGGIEEVAATALIARDALALLESSQDRLNLTFESAADRAYSASFAIAELAGGLDNLSALQSSYYQAFFTEAERAAHLQADLTQAMAEMGMRLPATRDGFRALVEAQDLNSEAGQRNYVALLQLAGGFDQLQTQLESLGGALVSVDLSGVRAAYEQLQSSIAAEQEILRNAHQATTRSINSNMRTVQSAMRDTERLARGLQNALDGMLRQGGGLGASRSSAQAYLRSVLASGGLGDPRELERALQVVSEPSEQLFGSFEDYQRDFWATANIVDQLNDRASEQLTTEERSLRALEQQLSQADRQFEREMARLDGVLERQTAMLEAEFGQLDWLQTINGSVLSMSDAIAALGGAIRSARAAQRDTAAVRASSPDYLSAKAQQLNSIGYEGRTDWSTSDVSRAFADAGLTQREHYERWGKDENIPGFATGGIASGPMSGYPVELHGTEAVIPLNGSSIPLNVPGIQTLVREVSELRRELAASQRAIAEHTRKSARVLERESMERRQEEVV